MVEKKELHEEGCRETSGLSEPEMSREEDPWEDDEWLRELVSELTLPKPLDSVSSARGPPPDVVVGKGTGEIQRENESRETEVERDEREQRDEREKSVERERRVLRERNVEREREIDEDQDLVAGLCGENRNFIAV